MRRILILLAVSAAMPALAAAPVKMSTALTAAAEVPGPGKGSGMAELTFDPDKAQVCYMLMSQDTDTPTMAHIHKGAAGVAGGVVVPLTPPANGMVQACAPVAADLMAAILANPSDYYVNIHTAAFPKGAMRGQIAK
jgi:hypothetical protein